MIKIKLILENVSENIIAKESIKIACFLRLEYTSFWIASST